MELTGSAGIRVTFEERPGSVRALTFRLDPSSPIPLFEQVRGQISVMVAVGLLEPGDRLPPVRELARQLGMAPGTVARTYRELEVDGIVEGRGRQGTFVVDEPPHSEVLQERRERVAAAARRYAFETRQLGADLDAALAAVTTAWDV